VFTVPSQSDGPPRKDSERPASQATGKNLPSESWGLKLVRTALGDPAAALEGALPGAFSGMLAGVVVGYVYGSTSPGAAPGEAIGRVLLGFVVGFGMGTVTGAILGVLSPAGRSRASGKTDWAPLVKGAVVGVVIALIVANYRWVLWGAGAGLAAAAVGQWLSRAGLLLPPDIPAAADRLPRGGLDRDEDRPHRLPDRLPELADQLPGRLPRGVGTRRRRHRRPDYGRE
jgi:hypothetical protein